MKCRFLFSERICQENSGDHRIANDKRNYTFVVVTIHGRLAANSNGALVI